LTGGLDHSCAIQASTGEIVCWGSDNVGQATPPDDVNGVSGTASDITAGHYRSCAIQAGTDEVVCWGWDEYGQATAPDVVNGVRGTASGISAGYDHTLAIVSLPEPTGWLAQSAGLALLCALRRRRTRKRGG
jgi:alpha-tubulin suppressor-like RCC1 family protein